MKKLLDNNIVKKVCKLGQGEHCCAFLMCGGLGFECAKDYPTLIDVINLKLDQNESVAKGRGGWKGCPKAEKKTLGLKDCCRIWDNSAVFKIHYCSGDKWNQCLNSLFPDNPMLIKFCPDCGTYLNNTFRDYERRKLRSCTTFSALNY